MDNITHTLVGFALAESGLKRRTRLGAAALVLGANLPDVDGFAYFVGSGVDALGFRRGWTHGVLAMAVLPLLLTGGLLGWARVRRVSSGSTRVDPGWLLALSAIGILSHPLLDLLNTYGVRLLMPFSGRWFYGDTLFIIDPWLWLILGAGLFLARRRVRRSSGPSGDRSMHAALLAGAVYVGVMALSSRLGVGAVDARTDGAQARRTLISPVFLNPFSRMVIRDLGATYEVGELRLGVPVRYDVLGRDPIGLDQPGAREAAKTPAGAAFLRWARFPYFHVERNGDSLRVVLGDMRYGRGPGGSWAAVRIVVPESHRGEPR